MTFVVIMIGGLTALGGLFILAIAQDEAACMAGTLLGVGGLLLAALAGMGMVL